MHTCESALIVRWKGAREEGALKEHDNTDEPQLSSPDGSMFFDIDDISSCPNRMDASAELLGGNNAQYQSYSATSSNNYLNNQSMLNGRPDDLDVFGNSKPSFSDGLSPSSYARQRALSDHFPLTIPPNVVYDGHFERLKPIFERCEYILPLLPSQRTQVDKMQIITSFVSSH